MEYWRITPMYLATLNEIVTISEIFFISNIFSRSPLQLIQVKVIIMMKTLRHIFLQVNINIKNQSVVIKMSFSVVLVDGTYCFSSQYGPNETVRSG